MNRFFYLILLLLTASSFVSHAVDRPPNIVLILSDDQSYTDYGFMGHKSIATPHLDKLASESALFRRGYVPTALCRPALMSLANGLYSHQNKTTGNNPAPTPANAAHAAKAGKNILEVLISHIDETGALPQWLAKAGYVSHQSGKWWEGSYQRGGFTEGMTSGYPNKGGRHGDAGLKIGRTGMAPVFDFIDRSVAAEKPFFVWYAPFMPHTPHTPPARLFEKYAAMGHTQTIAKYYAMCEWFDETCGALVNHIDGSGIKENTLVIYVTDNGWIQMPDRGGYAPRSKRSPNEGGTRTPIMFRWPGTIPAADRPELCSSIDLVPTILAAAKGKGPHKFPGLNLLPQLKSGKRIARDTLFGESFAHDIADIEIPQASLLYRWVIRGHNKLLLTYDGAPGKMKYPPVGGQSQLFDLKNDPGENINLAGKRPQLVKELGALLDDWYPTSQRRVGKVAPANKQAPTKARRKPRTRKQAATKPSSDRPNILLLFADDQRNHTLGCAGHPIVKTPNIDRLAAAGVRFENAFVSTSTCWVSRACLFTGTYERRHLYRTSAAVKVLDPKLCETSYFAVLKRAGYRTGHIGKEHVTISPTSSEAMFDVRRKIGRRPYFKPQADGSQRHETQILGDWGIEFLDGQPKDQPFCLTVSFNATHAEDGDKRPGIGHYPWPKVTDGMYEDQEMPLPPLNDPSIYDSQPEFLKKSINRQRFFWRWDTPEKYQTNMRAYFRMLSGIDHVVGRLAKQLEKQGLADNTVIIYTADNGYYLGDRGFAGKWTHYEQSLRVPLVVYDPRLPNRKRGRTQTEMTLNSDLASTMIELAGVPVPATHSGRSLVPLIHGKPVADWRSDFLCEFVAVPTTIPRWEGVRDRDWVYARYYMDGAKQPPFEFLHDLSKDPNQLVNLAALSADQRKAPNAATLIRLRQRCDELVAQNGPAMKDIPAMAKRPPRKQRGTKKKP
jgi:arylsulfatase A-like enzyme